MNIKEYFKSLRFSPAHHLGGGDIRLTMGQQDELEAELDAMREERDSEQRWAAQYAQEREHNAMTALAYKAELDAMRQAMSQVAANLGNGSFATVDASHEWMTKEVPEEVRLYCQRLRGELDLAKRELTEVQARETKATVTLKSRELELDAMTKERDRLRDVKWEGVLKLDEDLKAEREKVAKLDDIIRRAGKKFCEDGPDGEIASGMFRILGERLAEETI